jgi:hypothetical protein
MEESAGELQRLGEKLGAHWPGIARARAATAERMRQLHVGLAEFTSEDASVVVFGSLARGEYTSGSDLDWTLLVDGQTYPEQPLAADDAAAWVGEHVRGPGREGTFGSLAFSHDLVHHIGGAADTNRNLTQRILLLLESVPIGRGEAYTRVVRALLERYISEDFGWSHSARQSHVPRFLQNDIARYWRTVAVDFAYKRKERGGEGWALRTVKLRLSRKLTYAAGLVACFRCSMLPDLHRGFSELPLEDRARTAVEEMESFLRKTPLEMLAWAYLHFGLSDSAAALFGSYDRFLRMMDSDERARLAALTFDSAPGDPLFRTARELGDAFQDALDELFLPRSGGGFHELTRTYGVF